MRLPAFTGLMVAMALLGGCHRDGDNGAIEASVIAPAPTTGVKSPLATLLTDATSMGLVRLDRDGQVIAGAAARWAILDDGLDYIFRIDDGAGVPAREIARRLRAAVRMRKDAPERALVDAIELIQAVTGTVVEIRLSVPQPDLLMLLARPDYSVGAHGAMQAQPGPAGTISLRPAPGIEPRPQTVLIHAEPAPGAVARFMKGQSDIVLGGTFDDLPVARAAEPKKRMLRFDPAAGLFGLVLRNSASAAAAPALRRALSLALDRDRIVTAIGATGLAKATTLAGSQIEPALVDRRTEAAKLVAGGHPALRIALPAGPGADILFRLIAEDWTSIGVVATRVAPDAPADLALVDAVTSPGTRHALACALSAGCDPRDRLALIDPPYIPIAAPVRWSLVARRLDRFVENDLAAHPLDRLLTR
ncbi:ABC transporter substrate-binding protein [Sphingomonas sp. MMS24-J13]|uniref:ABC transporter substrate-binding protein n=1 Tax=Sphingomonas sp. MMS24-J13 TaxID=3238686 RepID=UPI00384F60E0